MVLSTEELKELGTGLQELLDVDDAEAFDPDADDADKLEWIDEAKELIDPDTDEPSENLTSLLEKLNAPETVEEPEPAPETVTPKKKEKGKKKSKKEKAAPKKAEKPKKEKAKAEKKEKPKKEKVEKAPAFTRIMAVAETMSGGTTDLDEVIEQSDALYVGKTGRDTNLKEAKWALGMVRQILTAFDLATVDKDASTIVLS